jgi:hypothetical protein
MKTTIRLFLAFLCFSVAGPKAKAVSPAPDGGYPGGNTAEGQTALLSLTTGGFNTAVGWLSLRSDITGSFNTAVGAGTLLANTADDNTATGAGAPLSNNTGADNTANGTFALFSNTTGIDNTGIGSGALESNTMGSFNTATGLGALALNATGSGNTANGVTALLNNTIGNSNTASGFEALGNNITGNGNTAIGRNALSNTTGGGNTALGTNAGSALTTGDNNIDIGFDVVALAGEANTIRIGNLNITSTYIRGISGATASGGAAVYVASDGQLGTMTSSARFKDDIKPMDKASEAILALKPVTFHYKSDKTNSPQFGLVAEEVAEVNPDLVVRDKNGEIYTVRYEAVNAMLLNEFLKEHNAFVEEQHKVEKLQTTVTNLLTTVKEQAAQIQKVSAQIEPSKFARGRIRRGGPAPRVVNNNQ